MKDDVISRQAVTKFLNDWLSCLFENCHKQSASDLKMIIKDFKNLPSAQPEPMCVAEVTLTDEQVKEAFEKAKCEILTVLDAQPERKRGKWIEYIPEHGKCPFCGNQVDLLNGKANNFCGECGADLRGKQDE